MPHWSGTRGHIVSPSEHRRPPMSRPFLFKWRHSAPEIIVCGLWWALRYASELDQHGRPWPNTTADSYRIGETYIKIKKQWHYLCRATNAAGATLDCMPRSTPRCRGRGTIFPPKSSHTTLAHW